jgi:protein involved in polysaccharide export with SLBB domain
MHTTLITSASSRIGRVALDLLLVIALLLVAMAQATLAQPSTSAPQYSRPNWHQIAVMGAVRTPSRLDASSPLRLLEVLGRVGGPNERAGKIIRIVHSCNRSPCDKLAPNTSDVSEYNLVDVLRDRENRNPLVVPGDIVIVPEVISIFVMGNVIEPKVIRLVERMTVTRALALAGGVGRGGQLVVIRIYRNSPDATRQGRIIVSLRAILEGHAADVLLQPLDVVEVSDELGHFRSLRPREWLTPIWDPPLGPRKDTSGA